MPLSHASKLRPTFRFALGAAFVLLAIVGGCSLGLDEARIGAGLDGGSEEDDTGPFDPDGGGGGDTSVLPGPDASACAKDEDCVAPNACLKGKCDLSRKACVYDVCKSAACTYKTCESASRTCTGNDSQHKYKTTQFLVGAPIRGRQFASIYPYLFVGTNGGIEAFVVSTPANPSPPKVPVVGLGFLPRDMIASGNRLYLIGDPVGTPSRFPIAWLDVPADPFTDKLVVRSTLANYNRTENPAAVYPAENDSALVVGPAGVNHPSVLVKAPLVEPYNLDAVAVPFVAGMGPVAASGSRLLMFRTAATGIPSFGFITGAGSAAPTNGGEIPLNDAGAVGSSQAFGQSPEGAVFWSVASLTGQIPPADPPMPAPTLRAARGFFLVPNATGNFETSAAVDVEVYAAGALAAGQNVIGPTAMIDGNTAIVLTAATENPTQSTAIQFVTKNPLGVVKDGANAKRVVLPIPPTGFVAAAGSNGIGFAVANDVVGPPANATVYVFDPGCAL